jgi:hypothetical protein
LRKDLKIMIKRYFKLSAIGLLVLFASTLFVSSCSEDEDYYSVGDFLVSFGVVEQGNLNQQNNLVVRLDNGDKAVSLISLPNFVEFETGQRVLINFAPYDDKANADSLKIYYGKFNKIQNILYKDILKVSAINKDSIGNDPVMINKTWLTGDSILNVQFTFYTQGSRHYINLVNNGEGNGITSPYVLEFRHNDRDDIHGYLASGYMSFKLNPIKVEGRHEVDFIIRYTDYEGKTSEIPHQLKY